MPFHHQEMSVIIERLEDALFLSDKTSATFLSEILRMALIEAFNQLQTTEAHSPSIVSE